MDNFYTQSSLRDFLTCPYKYKLKYIDGIYWFQDEVQNSFDLGSDFHTIAERYFLGLDNSYIEDENMKLWMNELKKHFLKKSRILYLPEYEIRYSELGLNMLARYDLLILEEDRISILDWKTNQKEIDPKEKTSDIQTKVYTYLLANSLPLFKEHKYSLESIRMIYWQPNYPDNKIEINYSFGRNLEYKKFFKDLTERIEKSDFPKNLKNCSFCEFNVFCNK